jgi:hypothetical protein
MAIHNWLRSATTGFRGSRSTEARGAMLACLLCLLASMSQADQSLPSFTEPSSAIVAAPQSSAASAAWQSLPSDGESLASDDPLADPESTTDQPVLSWSRLRRWTPQGLIPYFGRTPDSEKDRGIGGPLQGPGWRSQPFSISAFAGATNGGALISGHLHQQPSFYGGLNIGWDYDHYWGIEKRLGFGALNLNDANHQAIPQTGASVTGEYRLMYYPLGDARWRPFLTAGVGWSDFYFNDDHGARHLDTVGMIPFGVGFKYLWTERLAVRVDMIDEMTFGGGALTNFHYVALTAGLEVRYGHRLITMPWHRKSPDGD